MYSVYKVDYRDRTAPKTILHKNFQSILRDNTPIQYSLTSQMSFNTICEKSTLLQEAFLD